MTKSKKLSLRRHIAKMVDVVGPAYGPIVGLICYMGAKSGPFTSNSLNYSDLMPDQRLSLPIHPWFNMNELQPGYDEPHCK